jgi:cupin superfamily acireductone dioxygenase involved in methionine salvage
VSLTSIDGLSEARGIRIGDEVEFKAAKLGEIVVGEVVEIIPPGSLPSDDLMAAVAGSGRRSFKPCDHHRFAVKCQKSEHIYIPYGKAVVMQRPNDFRLSVYTADEVASLSKQQVEDVRIGKRDVAKLQELSATMKQIVADFDEVLARLAARRN